MRDYVSIGPTPCEEECAQLGQDDYREKAIAECKRFIALLRKTFGDEPPGARLAIKWFDHDFGQYCEVLCWFDSDNIAATDYAFRCEKQTPLTWKGGRRDQLRFSSK
jgi:hypothetical protein